MTAAGSLVIVYPLDFARTRLAADLGKDGVNREFKGLYDCLAGTMGRGGPFAVYQGFMTSMVMFTFYRGLYFGLYDTARDTLAWEHPVLKWCAPHPFHLSKILRPFSCPYSFTRACPACCRFCVPSCSCAIPFSALARRY